MSTLKAPFFSFLSNLESLVGWHFDSPLTRSGIADEEKEVGGKGRRQMFMKHEQVPFEYIYTHTVLLYSKGRFDAGETET